MKAKHILFTLVAAACAFATSPALQAQNIKIGLVDMQKALNDYKQTGIETDKINAQATIFQNEAKTRGEALKKIQDQMLEQKAIYDDGDKNEETRKKAFDLLQQLRQEGAAKQKEAIELGQKNAETLAKMRKDMEVKLVAEITAVMEAKAKENGADLVFDKSFLPRANKAIIYTSANVLDMTDSIISQLNSQ